MGEQPEELVEKWSARRGARGPDPQRVTPEQAATLEAAEQAAEARRRADVAYIDAVVAAHHAGVTVSAIAQAIGVSREATRQLVKRHADK